MKKLLKKLQRQKRGMVGLEAAIVLIAFVIIAAAFSFMVVNQGLFATERGKAVVQEGLDQASTPLTMDGSIFVRTTAAGDAVNCMVIPLRAFGIDYVACWKNETVVTLKVDQSAWGNVYGGVLYDSTTPANTYDPTGQQFDAFVGVTQNATKYVHGSYNETTMTTVAVLAIENSNGDEALNSEEKGYLIVSLDSSDIAPVRQRVVVEIRLEKSAPLSIEFNIPESLYVSTWHMV
jgi:flagellin FlaB